MSETVVVYEYDPAAHGEPGPGAVLRVHAAPAAPGQSSARGPRTLCGRDTFAMGTASWRPSEHPGSPWYPEEYADRVCPACADAAGEV
ncbi:hypothetical protein AB0F18_18500 [Streptomyces sp. NPDC029216]|uniref:hypothetical protein n=1 Tax=Streptomyces sp. NPDC029216 TaxID=3154701 RepID=UPI0033FA3727